jgi:3,4-dihydroxy 2-butanone 4-phosphate synthase
MSDLENISYNSIKNDLLNGKPVIVYDFKGREEESDMVFYGGSVSWESINTLRKEAGGLICYVTGAKEIKALGLNFLTDEWARHPSYATLIKRPSYGDFPSFAIWVNHISVTTGISDIDRSKTITELHKIFSGAVNNPRERFYQDFYAPGHVPILASRGLENRKGHTELVTSLAEKVGLPRSMVIAEMLGNGRSLGRDFAEEYASENGYKFIEGEEILKF